MPCARNLRVPAGRWVSVLLLLAAAVLPSCSGAGEDPGETSVEITLTDFKMAPALTSVDAGAVRLEVYNESPVTHEFVVVRSDLPADALPLGADGISVDEDHIDVVGWLGDVPTKDEVVLGLDLAPGRYVFFCNLEGHYLGGMHGSLDVSDA